MEDGVLIDLEQEDAQELIGPPRLDWIAQRVSETMFGSDVIAAAAIPPTVYYDYPGIYFLIWKGKVCYVGQAGCVGHRLHQHGREGRPIEKVAVILGLPLWALTEVEHAYIRAFDPPWNVETTRCGQVDEVPGLLDAAKLLNRDQVMPYYAPTVTASHARWKAWQLAVLGYQQHEARADRQ